MSYAAATNSLGAWVYGGLSVELFVASLLLVDQEEAAKTDLREGDRRLLRINHVLLPEAPKAEPPRLIPKVQRSLCRKRWLSSF